LILAKVIDTEHVKYTLRGGVRNLLNAVDTYTLNNRVFDSTNLGRNYWCEIQMNF
jgi:outer membrane receptor protein involved in Fe transport